MQAVLELSKYLGDNSRAMQLLLKQEADDPYILESLNRLSKTPTGKAYLDHLTDDKIAPLDDVQMNSLYELNWQFEPDKELATRLIELTAHGMKPNELERFIFEHTESIEKVRDMIRSGATAEQLELTRLQSLESLGEALGEHKNAMDYLLQFEKMDWTCGRSQHFRHPPSAKGPRADLLLELVDHKAPISQFAPNRLEDLFWVTKNFGKDTPPFRNCSR